jgi:hypothetical protein
MGHFEILTKYAWAEIGGGMGGLSPPRFLKIFEFLFPTSISLSTKVNQIVNNSLNY